MGSITGIMDLSSVIPLDHGLVISYTIGTWQLPGNMDLDPPGQHSTWELNQNL